MKGVSEDMENMDSDWYYLHFCWSRKYEVTAGIKRGPCHEATPVAVHSRVCSLHEHASNSVCLGCAQIIGTFQSYHQAPPQAVFNLLKSAPYQANFVAQAENIPQRYSFTHPTLTQQLQAGDAPNESFLMALCQFNYSSEIRSNVSYLRKQLVLQLLCRSKALHTETMLNTQATAL